MEGVMGQRPVFPHIPWFWSVEFTWVGSQKVSLQVLLQKTYPQMISGQNTPKTYWEFLTLIKERLGQWETLCGKAMMSYFRLDVLTLCGPTWLGLTKQFFGTLWGILWDPANLMVLYMQSAICINSTQSIRDKQFYVFRLVFSSDL